MGRVIDADTRESLVDVSVFLDQTTRGAATDHQGDYEIGGLKSGLYSVVASMIGYKAEAKSVEVRPESDVYEINFVLRKDVIDVGGIEIVAERDRAWERHLQSFTQEYLGSSRNAAETVILNPFVLDFSTRDGSLHATASAPLEIENRALGFHLTILLTYYHGTTRIVQSGGPIYFRELIPADEKEARRWRENREKAYRGSFMHLIRCLVEGNTRQQGFFVAHEIPPSAYNGQRRRLELGLVPFMFPGDQPHLYRLRFDNELYVEYGRETSWLWLNDHEAILHEDGYLETSAFEKPPMSVRGDMAFRRVADLLPRDYRPK